MFIENFNDLKWLYIYQISSITLSLEPDCIYIYACIDIKILPRDKMKPPNTITASNANEPNVFATMIFLPSDPMNLNSAEAVWLRQTSRRYCLKNLAKPTSIRLRQMFKESKA